MRIYSIFGLIQTSPKSTKNNTGDFQILRLILCYFKVFLTWLKNEPSSWRQQSKNYWGCPKIKIRDIFRLEIIKKLDIKTLFLTWANLCKCWNSTFSFSNLSSSIFTKFATQICSRFNWLRTSRKHQKFLLWFGNKSNRKFFLWIP